MEKYRVIGIMSGSSMDGVDLAYCEFEDNIDNWSYLILAAETIPYNEKWRVRLSQLYKQPAHLYPKTDLFYGKYLGQLVNDFIQTHSLTPDLISSHGHTVFHQPEAGFTAQVGNGAAIHAETGLPVVCDFRTVDVMLGGQGAPLVPIGDRKLFAAYDACLNLGGFANISFTQNGSVKAFDIGPCNIILNRIARNMELPYDNKGEIAAKGQVHEGLLDALNELDFYQLDHAKSLGREWINAVFWPVTRVYELSHEDKLATFSEHIADQISNVINKAGVKKVFVTGGGAFNDNMLSRVRTKVQADIIVPEEHIVNYKEALIFAFLGVLRIRNQVNCLRSVTGATRDNIGGSLFGNYSNLF